MDNNNDFKLTHGSATPQKALDAADRVERWIGRVVNGERRALDCLNPEDIALLVQFVRNEAKA